MTVPHHQSAVEAAKVARTRTTRPELRTLGEAIIKAQESEIAQLKQWRKEWYGSDQTPGMERMPIQFIDMMREHHRMAIVAGKLAQTRGQRNEIKELGGRIVIDQQREIDQMTEWRRAWYGSA